MHKDLSLIEAKIVNNIVKCLLCSCCMSVSVLVIKIHIIYLCIFIHKMHVAKSYAIQSSS